MRNRFAVPFEELPDDMKDHIIIIQLHTNLVFDKAEDWTAQNQGWVLKFKGDWCKGDNRYDDVIKDLQMEFMLANPGLYTIEEALFYYGEKATAFECMRVNYNCDGYDLFIKQTWDKPWWL